MRTTPTASGRRGASVTAAVTAALLAGVVFTGAGAATARQSKSVSSDDITHWARAHRHEVALDGDDFADLEPVKAMIGDARVVVLGEGQHGPTEPLRFRNRLFRFLVEKMGFTAIALESALVPGLAVNEYVAGGPGNAADVAQRGITFGLGRFPRQATLLEWMRGYNARSPHSKIEFYGMDVSDLADIPPGQGALEHALGFVDGIDPAASARLRDRLNPYRMVLTGEAPRRAGKTDSYATLAAPDRDAISAVVADLLTLVRVNEGRYTDATSAERYRVGLRAAVAARQADSYLRQFAIVAPGTPIPPRAIGTVAVADYAKVENIAWILEKHRRVLVFSHYGHAAPSPVKITMPDGSGFDLPPMMGTYLKRRYGTDVVTIGHVFGRDEGHCGETRPLPAAGSLERQLSAVGTKPFLLDLRRAPAAINQTLTGYHDLYGQSPTHSLKVRPGTELLLFTPAATPDLPCK